MCAGGRVQSPIPSPVTHYHRMVHGPKTGSDRKEQLEVNTCESTTAFIYRSSSIIRRGGKQASCHDQYPRIQLKQRHERLNAPKLDQNWMVLIHIYNTSKTFSELWFTRAITLKFMKKNWSSTFPSQWIRFTPVAAGISVRSFCGPEANYQKHGEHSHIELSTAH